MQQNDNLAKSSTQPSTQSKELEPKLARPGAGIPWFHRLLGHIYLRPFVAEKTPWEVSTKRFLKTHGKILEEIEGLSQQQMTTKVLVPSQRGLEDSSRFWSISMALEHLMIVGQQIEQGLHSLGAGRPVEQKVDIAAVKPKGATDFTETLLQFRAFAKNTPAQIEARIQNKDSKVTLNHPWFGPLSAKGWYWLLAMHGAIHLQQIREIKKEL